jgi:hypothetical protein
LLSSPFDIRTRTTKERDMATSPTVSTDKDTLEAEANGIVRTARDVADTVAGVAGDVGARLPDAAAGTGKAITDAGRLIQTGSDDTLKLAGAMSVGFALGLFVGGAPRLLVVAALLPTGLIATTLAERMQRTTTRRSGAQAA